MIRDSLIQTIERLTEEHELYQQMELGGQHDPNWPSWYADRLLQEEGFCGAGVRLTAGELADILEAGFASFAAGPENRWSEYIADRILS